MKEQDFGYNIEEDDDITIHTESAGYVIEGWGY